MSNYTYAPTVIAAEDFEAWNDAQVLRESMKGLGTDEDSIVELLTQRTNGQRLEIEQIYKTQFGRDLIEDLKNELGGNFEDVIIALLTPFETFLGQNLYNAISGAGTDENSLIEIMYTTPPNQIPCIKEAFTKISEKELEEAIENDTSGWFKKILVSLTTGLRDSNDDVDSGLAIEDAKVLHDAGAEQWGTDESTFLSILATRNFAQLRKMFDEYLNLTSKTIEESIESELSGDTQMGFLSIVKCARNMPAYFAQRLYEAMKSEGAGTIDSTLIRIVVIRCELDMALIKKEFEIAYEQTLEDFIQGDTSGDYKKVLLALVKD